MDRLEQWVVAFPGYGGFLPWFSVFSGVILPLPDWRGRVPALDNGQMAWGFVAVAEALRQTGASAPLLERVEKYLGLLRSTVRAAFFEDGAVRAVAKVLNETAEPGTTNFASDGLGRLNDPYEGELCAAFLTLLGDGVSPAEADAVWRSKRAMLQPVLFRNSTLQRGWWFSSHEQWKYLFLPYVDVPVNWQLFVNGEMARTMWGASRGRRRGLCASCNNVTSASDPFHPAYLSDNGITEFAFSPSPTSGLRTVTPYAAFSVMLANQSIGLAWWRSVVELPGASSPAFGALESVLEDGSMRCPMMTWDTKVTTFVAALGGTVDLVRSFLRRTDAYHLFVQRIAAEWNRAFPTVLRSPELVFMLPK